MLGDGWHTVGFWLAHCWFMVGRMLLYGWRFMLGQRVSNEQSNVGLTKYVAVGPTLNQRLGFGWRMVIVLAGHYNLFLFFICSRNLEHIRVMAPPMKVNNTSLPLPALQRLDRCLNALSTN